MAVLGAMMLEREAVEKAALLLTADAFYYDAHGAIYRAMRALADRGEPVDIVTLNDELRGVGKLGDVGGSHYLSELAMRTPTAANVEHHARIVAEKALLRRTIAMTTATLAEAYDAGADAFDVIERAQARLIDLMESRLGGRGYRTMRGLVISAIEEAERRQALRKAGKPVGVPTGFTRLDGFLDGGLQPEELIILGARPSMGKTGLTMDMTINAALAGKRVGVISLEMGGEALVTRALSGRSGVPHSGLRSGEISDAEWQALMNRGVMQLADLPIFIDDTPNQTPEEAIARARIMHRREAIDLLVLDFLTLLEMGSGGDERGDVRVGRAVRLFKRLAMDLRIPALILAQLNRAATTGGGDSRPKLQHLRESGGIEEAADVVMFLHRPEYYGVSMEEIDGRMISTHGMAEVLIAKQRNGRNNVSAWLHFEASFCRFFNNAAEADLLTKPF